MQKKLLISFVLITGVCFSQQAFAVGTLIFDNESAGGASLSSRGAETSPGALINVAVDTAIVSISVLNNLDSDGQMKFLIFDHATHNLLFESAAQAFVDDGLTWKMSDPLSFLLEAGNSYDIGAIADVGGLWSFDNISDSQNGLTSVVTNPNFSDFANPVTSNALHAGADGHIRLFVADNTGNNNAVPEPLTASLGLMGLGVLGMATRRRVA